MDSFSPKQFRWPSFAQWRQLPRVLSQREKIVLGGMILVFTVSFFSLAQGLYVDNTQVAPARGGSFTEGIVGSPRFLNPVYADANDADRDLIQLIYSGLLRYDAEGNLIPDLAAAEPEIAEGGKTVTVLLKENVAWHDGTPFTARDVVFTVQTIQDPAYKSPIRANWIGVEVEAVSDYMIRFYLLDAYAPFLERLTLKILPAHLWEDIPAENFVLTPLNLRPIGTGPWELTKVDQARSGFVQRIELKAYEEYYGTIPFIESISFRFFATEDDLLREANRGGIESFSLTQLENLHRARNPFFESYAFFLPRYFALFFNLDPPNNQSEFAQNAVREALSLATNRKELIERVFQGNARLVSSPFLPSVFDFESPEIPSADKEQALALLEQAGYSKENGKIGKPQLTGEALTQDLDRGATGEAVRRLQQCLAQDPTVYPEGIVNGSYGQLTQGAVIRFQEKYAEEVLAPLDLAEGTGKAGPLTREKLNALCFAGDQDLTPFSITLTTVDHSPVREVAEELKRQWEGFGFEVEIQALSPNELERDAIGPRSYQTLLFGEVLGTIPDPFPFWHSSQAKAPGLNLSSYNNQTIDRLLEDARKEFDSLSQLELFTQAQELLLQDTPALFLYDIDYTYFVSKEIQGIQPALIADPSQRFQGLHEWYVKTKRVPN